MEKKESYTELSPQEVSDFYARLKTDLRIKTMELQKKQNKMSNDMLSWYFDQEKKDKMELDEFLGNQQDISIMSEEERIQYYKKSESMMHVAMSYRPLKNRSNPTFEAMKKAEVKNKIDLVRTFRTDHAMTIDIYKKVWKELRKSPDFKEQPRHLWDKAYIEEKINKVRIGEPVGIEDILPYFWKVSPKIQHIILDYFEWGDPSILAKTLGVSHKRLRQMRNYGIRKMVHKAIDWDLNIPCPDPKNIPQNLSQEVLEISIDDVDGLSLRSKKYLLAAGIDTIGKLFQYTRHELLKIENIGKRTIDEVDALRISLSAE